MELGCAPRRIGRAAPRRQRPDAPGHGGPDLRPQGARRVEPTMVKHLNQIELARRWTLSARTLERWRCAGEGPRYLKIGGRVVYRLEDIEAFEAAQARGGGDDQRRSIASERTGRPGA